MRGGGTRGWVDFFITAAIIAPSDRASLHLLLPLPLPHYVLGRKGNILVLKIIAASRLANGAVCNWKKSRLTYKNVVSNARFFPLLPSLSLSFSFTRSLYLSSFSLSLEFPFATN